jgi:hypothetical protein
VRIRICSLRRWGTYDELTGKRNRGYRTAILLIGL